VPSASPLHPAGCLSSIGKDFLAFCNRDHSLPTGPICLLFSLLPLYLFFSRSSIRRAKASFFPLTQGTIASSNSSPVVAVSHLCHSVSHVFQNSFFAQTAVFARAPALSLEVKGTCKEAIPKKNQMKLLQLFQCRVIPLLAQKDIFYKRTVSFSHDSEAVDQI